MIMKNSFLIIIFSVLIISCKNQEKEKTSKYVNLTDLTLLGVVKTDSLYTVNNRCDGGYTVLRFYNNKFYFYVPQEGSYYITESIQEITKGSYKIITKGYYFLQNEKTIQEKSTWHLKKINELLWDFENDKLKTKYQLADTTNLIKKKIVFYNQPCKECWDDEQCDELESAKNTLKKVKKNSTEESIELAKNEFIKNELPKLKKLNKNIGGIDVLEGYVGDVTNDKIDDIILFYSLTAKDGNVDIDSGLFIYTNKDNSIELLENIVPEYMFYVEKIYNNSIYIKKMEYAENDDRCCPSLKSEIQLKVNKTIIKNE